MKLDAAQRRIAAFEKRFSDAHIDLACHAALPLALTPDLLYCIWGNFQRDIEQNFLGIPWIAVSDLILSSLCDEVGDELYEMDQTVRQELLERLKQNRRFGKERLQEVAGLLLAYVRRDLNHPDFYYQDFAESQTWAALAYINPQESVRRLVAAFERAYGENPADLMRLVTLTEMLHQPIPEFEKLLIFARAMGHYRRKKYEDAKGEIKKLTIKGDRVDLGNNITISIPPELLELIASPPDTPQDEATQKKIAELLKVIKTTQNENSRRQAIRSLGEIGQGNPIAIAGLLKVIQTTQDEYTCIQAAVSLEKIDPGNPAAIAGLVKVIETTQDEYTLLLAIRSLEKIGQGNSEAIAGLVEIIETTEDDYTRWQAIRSLEKIDPGNPEAIAGLVKVVQTAWNENTRMQAISSLRKIDPGNPAVIAGLVKVIETTQNENTRKQAAESLGKIGQGNLEAIAGLVKVIETTQDEDTRMQAAEILEKIDPGNPAAIAGLVKVIETNWNEDKEIDFTQLSFVANFEPVLPIVLLLDTSGSMSGQPINELNQGLVTFQEELNKDALASMRVEVAIITFNSFVNIVQDFVKVNQFKPPHLSASGTTGTGKAIEVVLNLIEDRKAVYRNNGIDYYSPLVLLITDGSPTDNWQNAAKMVREFAANKKFNFFAVGVDGADLDILSQIAPTDTPPLMLRGLSFVQLFQWLSYSISAVSRSIPGDQVTLPSTISWADSNRN